MTSKPGRDIGAIVDLIGKGGHIRTVPIPQWAKQALDEWISAADITKGKIFRAVARSGKVWGPESQKTWFGMWCGSVVDEWDWSTSRRMIYAGPVQSCANDLFDLKIDTQTGENRSEQHDDGASVSPTVLLPPRIECRREDPQSAQPDSLATEMRPCRVELDTGT